MKIVLVSNTTWYLVNFRSGLIKALVNSGFDVYAVSPPDSYIAKLEQMGATYIPINIDNKGLNPFRDISTFISFFRIYRYKGFDIALHFTIKPVVYGGIAARLLNIAYISTITGLGTAFIKKSYITYIAEFLYRISQTGVCRMLFQNHEDRRLFIERRLCKESNSEVVSAGSGVDIDYFSSQPLPSHHNVSDKRLTFLLMSRMLLDKGIAEFVSAARILKLKYPDMKFQLLGPLGVDNRTAVSRDTINAWITEGVVEYLGSVDDVRPFLRDCDCVVLPSYREGLSRALLEAASMGRPLIASDVAGCREIVEHGVNGFLCRPGSAEALANCCDKYVNLDYTDRLNMSIASREKAETRFNQDIVIDQYINLIRNCLKAKK